MLISGIFIVIAMNIPEIYLVEPYNAYAPKQNKKHWHQVIEEQALMARLVAEQMALQEAASKTLPPTSPEVSTPTVGTAAGAGGVYPPQVFNSTNAVVTFSFTPASGAGPLTIQFTNQTSNAELYTYRWFFSDGQTSTLVNPTIIFQSGSSATNLITSSLQATSSVFGTAAATSGLSYISASKPTVTSGFTFITSSNVAPYTVTVVNTTLNTSQTPTTTYLWTFTNGNITSSSTSINTSVVAQSGSFTASLQATGSYGIATRYTQSFFATAPSVTAAFTLTTSSTAVPSTASFVNTSIYNGSGTLTYLWTYGSGSITSSVVSPDPVIYRNAGPYTASLQVTESLYGIASFATRSWKLS